MAHFAGYGFNKSHSAGYAIVAYQTAYLKAHHPVEFMAAVLTSEMSSSDRVKLLLSEARRMGIAVLPPAVNRSADAFTVEEGAIRFGMGAVKGVGHAAVAAICEARGGGPFEDLYDLVGRVDSGAINRKCLEALIFAGALDAFGWPRARLLEALPRINEWAVRRRRERDLGQESLFGGGGAASPRPPAPEVAEWDAAALLSREKSALGFYVSGHPMDRYRRVLERMGSRGIAELALLPEGAQPTIAGLIVQAKTSVDRKGRPLAFATLEDASGSIECILFEEPLEGVKRCLSGEEPVLVTGRLSSRGGETAKLVAGEARPLEHALRGARFGLHLAIESARSERELRSLRGILESEPGPCPVYLHVDHRALGGVVMRSRSLRVALGGALLERICRELEPWRVRVVAEGTGARSAELFSAPAPAAEAVCEAG
jgi:DNA polymerase-3 subunit alpha